VQRNQKSYDVVNEGQASGVTSTINGPGETPPPMTNTSADTTSNFTLAPNVDTTGTLPPGTIAGTLPPAYPPMTSSYPAQPRAPRPQQPRQQPPPQQPQWQVPPPPSTDTTATTAPPPPPDKTDTTETEEQKPPSEDEQQPPPPPPPTQTDTRGW
jgi:hypothetical protein